MLKLVLLFAVTIRLLLMTCHPSLQSAAMLKAISNKADARIKVSMSQDTARVDIFSESGIGNADIEITSKALPQQIVFRFHLRGLEELRFAYGNTVVTASLSSSEQHEVRQSLSRTGEMPIESQVLASNSTYWMKVRDVSLDKIALQDGYIEVEVPEDFLVSGIRRASIRWIDFYR
jgi:hypothetical protein